MSSSQAKYLWKDFYWLLEPAIFENTLFVVGVGQGRSFIFGAINLQLSSSNASCSLVTCRIRSHMHKFEVRDHSTVFDPPLWEKREVPFGALYPAGCAGTCLENTI